MSTEAIKKVMARIYAGEGELLSLEWEGETTRRGLKQRLASARCGGARNAYAVSNPYELLHGGMGGIDIETGEARDW